MVRLATSFAPHLTLFSQSESRKAAARADHLLNFSFTERAAPSPTSAPPPRRPARRPTRFNRDRFVKANYSFVVRNDLAYTSWLHSPDAPLDWSTVDHVIINGDVPGCPVCLSPPVAGKMTKCGHVLCWTCYLRCAAHSGDKNSTACPLCFEAVVEDDLRPVMCVQHRQVVSGEMIDFVLVMRPRDVSLAIPRASFHPLHLLTPPPFDDRSPAFPFFKLHMMTSSSSIRLIARETEDLLEHFSLASAADEHDTLPYYHRALSLLCARALSDPSTAHLAVHLQKWETADRVVVAARELPMPAFPPNFPRDFPPEMVSMHTKDAFYFYQAADGRPIYMHPVFLRLLAGKEGFEQMPDHVACRVAEVEAMTQTEESRKKYRFLGHLPLSAAFVLVGVANESLPASVNTRKLPHDIVQYRARMHKQGKERTVHVPAFSRDMYDSAAELRAMSLSDSDTADTFQLEAQLETSFPAISPAISPANSPAISASASSSYARAAALSTFEEDFPAFGVSASGQKASSWRGQSQISKEEEGEKVVTEQRRKKGVKKQTLFSTSALRPQM